VVAGQNIAAVEGQHTVETGWCTVVAGRCIVAMGIGCGGPSVHVLVDDAGKYVLHPPQGILKYRYCVLRFDYGGGWWRCTEGRGNGKDSGDVGLSNSAN
jgi:hypothetical protein